MGDREREVGLGRVVEDRTSREDSLVDQHGDRQVEHASADSFPASDPPTWMSGPATPGDGVDETDDQPS